MGFAADWRWVIPTWAVILGLGAMFGPRYGPFLRLYADVIRPRLAPPGALEDPRPPRFAAGMGAAVLTIATLALLGGAPGVAWSLALVVAALAALSAVTGLCVGCEIWRFGARRRGVAEVA